MSLDPTAPVLLEDGAVAIGGRPVLRHVDLAVRAGEFVIAGAATPPMVLCCTPYRVCY